MSSSANLLILYFMLLNTAFCANDIGSVCTLKSSGASGVCKLLTDCTKIHNETLAKLHLYQTCGSLDTQPIICCPSSPSRTTKPGEKSKQKCKLYSSYANADNAECGHNIKKRIVNGVAAGRKEFPHMALLGYERNGTTLWQCGGTIISEKYILTAAHCLFSKFTSRPKLVQVGVSNTMDNDHKQTLNIADVIHHPDYKSPQKYNDIGLVKLEKPIQFNSYARPACLNYDLQKSFDEVIATGWGAKEYTGNVSDDLQKVTIKVVQYDECKTAYEENIGKILPDGIRNDTHICAGVRKDEKDTCQGDAGGPIQIYHTGDEIQCMYDIVGITSFGKACFGDTSVYTRVSTYLEWIEDIVWP